MYLLNYFCYSLKLYFYKDKLNKMYSVPRYCLNFKQIKGNMSDTSKII